MQISFENYNLPLDNCLFDPIDPPIYIYYHYNYFRESNCYLKNNACLGSYSEVFAAYFLATRQKNMHTDPMIKFNDYNSSIRFSIPLIFRYVILCSYLRHFYFADSFVDIVTDLVETDCKTPDFDTMREVVEIVRYEKLVVGLVDWNPIRVELNTFIIKEEHDQGY